MPLEVRVEEAAEALLRAGKSLCLVGPPGSGKTRLASRLTHSRGYDVELVTGHEGLTHEDLMSLEHGAIARSVVRTWARYLCGKPPVWVIFDEVNRAKVETVLGKVFTLLDVDYRVEFTLLPGSSELGRVLRDAVNRECRDAPPNQERLEKLVKHAETEGLPMPLSWRMIATMNLLDMSHLYQVGYAFARRAPLLPVTGGRHAVETRVEPSEMPEEAKGACMEMLERLLIEIPRVVRSVEPWSILPDEVIARFEAPLAPLNPRALLQRFARSIVWAVLKRVSNALEELGLLTGPAVYIDACRLLAANYGKPHELLADVIVSSLLAPQVTFVTPRARLEAALGSTATLEKIGRLVKLVDEALGPHSLSAWSVKAYTMQVTPLLAGEAWVHKQLG